MNFSPHKNVVAMDQRVDYSFGYSAFGVIRFVDAKLGSLSEANVGIVFYKIPAVLEKGNQPACIFLVIQRVIEN